VPFSTDGHRVEIDLGSPSQRQRWLREFAVPVEAAIGSLPSRGVRVQALSSDEPSESWLPLLGRARPLVA
jgi:hypothetical protein